MMILLLLSLSRTQMLFVLLTLFVEMYHGATVEATRKVLTEKRRIPPYLRGAVITSRLKYHHSLIHLLYMCVYIISIQY